MFDKTNGKEPKGPEKKGKRTGQGLNGKGTRPPTNGIGIWKRL
jgi:hypothetical protein